MSFEFLIALVASGLFFYVSSRGTSRQKAGADSKKSDTPSFLDDLDTKKIFAVLVAVGFAISVAVALISPENWLRSTIVVFTSISGYGMYQMMLKGSLIPEKFTTVTIAIMILGGLAYHYGGPDALPKSHKSQQNFDMVTKEPTNIGYFHPGTGKWVQETSRETGDYLTAKDCRTNAETGKTKPHTGFDYSRCYLISVVDGSPLRAKILPGSTKSMGSKTPSHVGVVKRKKESSVTEDWSNILPRSVSGNVWWIITLTIVVIATFTPGKGAKTSTINGLTPRTDDHLEKAGTNNIWYWLIVLTIGAIVAAILLVQIYVHTGFNPFSS